MWYNIKCSQTNHIYKSYVNEPRRNMQPSSEFRVDVLDPRSFRLPKLDTAFPVPPPLNTVYQQHLAPIPTQPLLPTVRRRVQVKLACINCRKSCKKCEEKRPCSRCVSMGIPEKCIDAPRRERRRPAYAKNGEVEFKQTARKYKNTVQPTPVHLIG